MTADQDLAGLRLEVRKHVQNMDAHSTVNGSWNAIRDELVRLAHSESDLLGANKRLISISRDAEAELAALKRSTQGTVQAVRPQADGCYLVEVCCDSAGVASLFSQRVALLPVGGEG